MAGKMKEDITGKRYGVRTVLGISKNDNGRIYWKFKCGCGFVGETLSQNLTAHNRCVWCAHKAERPYRRKRPYEAQYNIFINRARFPVTITYEQYTELAKQNECHYCGAEIIWSEYRRADRRGGNGSNLDRKDFKRGYDIENVVVCCGRCNYAKGTHFTYEEWKKIGRLIKSWCIKQTQPVTPVSGRALANLERILIKLEDK